jgi:hypothetical protein
VALLKFRFVEGLARFQRSALRAITCCGHGFD